MTLRSLKRLRRFRRGEEGTASVEFVILFPMIMWIFLSGIDAGFMMMRNAMLERGVDLAVRDLRLGDPSPPTYAEFRQTICVNALGFVPDCLNSLQVELTGLSIDTTDPIDPTIRCINKEEPIIPADLSAFYGDTGGNNEWMLVRACVNVNPQFDFVFRIGNVEFKSLGSILNSDGRNGYFIVATSAYVNEPSRLEDG